MEQLETLPQPSRSVNAKETIKNAIEGGLKKGLKIEFPRFDRSSTDKPLKEAAIGLMSMGALEIVQFLNPKLRESPLATLRENVSKNGHSYELTVLALGKNQEGKEILIGVYYDDRGNLVKKEDRGLWEANGHNPNELGIPQADQLPESIDPTKTAQQMLESLRIGEFKQLRLEESDKISPISLNMKATIEEAIREEIRTGHSIILRGRTTDKLMLDSAYECMSGIPGIIKLRRDGLQVPLITLVETGSEATGHAYEFTILAVDKDKEGNYALKRVFYDRNGTKEKTEDAGRWELKTHTPEVLGIYNYTGLPEHINSRTVAEGMFSGLEMGTFKPPALSFKVERIQIKEHEPIGDEALKEYADFEESIGKKPESKANVLEQQRKAA